MRKSRYTEEQIVMALRQAEAGRPVVACDSSSLGVIVLWRETTPACKQVEFWNEAVPRFNR